MVYIRKDDSQASNVDFAQVTRDSGYGRDNPRKSTKDLSQKTMRAVYPALGEMIEDWERLNRQKETRDKEKQQSENPYAESTFRTTSSQDVVDPAEQEKIGYKNINEERGAIKKGGRTRNSTLGHRVRTSLKRDVTINIINNSGGSASNYAIFFVAGIAFGMIAYSYGPTLAGYVGRKVVQQFDYFDLLGKYESAKATISSVQRFFGGELNLPSSLATSDLTTRTPLSSTSQGQVKTELQVKSQTNINPQPVESPVNGFNASETLPSGTFTPSFPPIIREVNSPAIHSSGARILTGRGRIF